MKTKLAIMLLAILAITSPASSVAPPAKERTEQADAHAVRSTLMTLSGQLELYRIANDGAVPNFAELGWAPFLDGGYIEKPPVNPFAEPAVADRLAVVNTPGAEGDAVSRATAGWVWNTADEQFHPAGTTEADLFAKIGRMPGAPIIAPDRSLSARAYAELGAPDHERVWSGDDMKRMSRALTRVFVDDPAGLPRFESSQSGAVFARLCAADNLELYERRSLPPVVRMTQMVEYVQASNRILRLYLAAFERGRVDGREMVELFGHQLRTQAAMLTLLREFLPALDPSDPSQAAQVQDLDQMRDGLESMATGLLDIIDEQDAYSSADRRRLLMYMEETLPALVVQLPPASQQRLIRRIDAMSTRPRTSDLAAELTALANTLRRSVVLVEVTTE
jgi:hypothetical protein